MEVLSHGTRKVRITYVRIGYVVILIFLLCIIYGQLYNHEFLNLDDHIYVTENQQVINGLSLAGIGWAFSTFHAEFWHPLTWISLMLDTTIHGVVPAGYLLSNAILHLCNSFLVFWLLYSSTDKIHRSWLVALLFCVHPLHVESVAWISDRKDILCALYWLASLIAYVRFCRTRGKRDYLFSLVMAACAMLAKPMAMTIPLLMVLLDYWPLQRIGWIESSEVRKGWRDRFVLFTEKLPFLVLSFICGIVAIVAQSAGDGVISYLEYPIAARITNVFAALFDYLRKTLVPSDLAIFYPFSEQPEPAKIIAGVIMFVCSVGISLALRKNYRYAAWGWLWFLIALMPVIGVFKVGDFSIADRYMYMPMLGLLVIVVWGTADFLSSQHVSKVIPIGTAVLVVLVFTTVSFLQVSYWQNSESLYRRTIAVYPESYMAHFGLAKDLAQKGNQEEALYHFDRAADLAPERVLFRATSARYMAYNGRLDDALTEVKRGLSVIPNSATLNYLQGIMSAERENASAAVNSLIHALLILAEKTTSLEESKWISSEDTRDFRISYLKTLRAIYSSEDRATMEAVLASDPSNLPVRIFIAMQLIAHGSDQDQAQDALEYLYVGQEQSWFRTAYSKGIEWWSSQFPPGSLEALALDRERQNRR